MESSKKQSFAGQRCPAQGRRRCREYKAIHEENFLSSWLREDGKSKMKEDQEVEKEDETVVERTV